VRACALRSPGLGKAGQSWAKLGKAGQSWAKLGARVGQSWARVQPASQPAGGSGCIDDGGFQGLLGVTAELQRSWAPAVSWVRLGPQTHNE